MSQHQHIITDLADKKLKDIPNNVLRRGQTKMLYLEKNFIEYLPEDFFQLLPMLTWLDLRNNKLKEIPKGIINHACLETLLLQDNLIQVLPEELGLVPRLKVLQLAGNPIRYPSEEILKQGVKGICEFLKTKMFSTEREQIPVENVRELCTETQVEPKLSKEKLPLKKTKKKLKKMTIQQLLQASSRTATEMGSVWPVITIKHLEKNNKLVPKKTVADVFFIPKSSENKVTEMIKRSSRMSASSSIKLKQKNISETPPIIKRSKSKESLKFRNRPRSANVLKSQSKESSPTNQVIRNHEKYNKNNNIRAHSRSLTNRSPEREMDKYENYNSANVSKTPPTSGKLKKANSESSAKTDRTTRSKFISKANSESSAKTDRTTRSKLKSKVRSSSKESNSYRGEADKVITLDELSRNEVESMWVENLKEVLNEQENELKHKRNSQALQKWRHRKQMEEVRNVNLKKLENPYDTDPEYDRMMSRNDLRQNSLRHKKRKLKKKPIIEKDLDNILEKLGNKLKELESGVTETNDPKLMQNQTEKQIKEIMRLQKKIQQVRKTHNI